LFCLSLPPDLRYKPENVFIAGIIPGPHEPTVLGIHNILNPLVEELCGLWEGLQVELPTFPTYQVRTALIALTSDLPAARKVAGFGSHSATYPCSHCYIRKQDLTSLDIDSWTRRCYHRHRMEATAWLDLQTMKQKDDAFLTNGVRWSVLLKLPYWDPTRMVAVDIMRNLSGILEYHTRKLWGIDSDQARKRDLILRRDQRREAETVSQQVQQVTQVATESDIDTEMDEPHNIERAPADSEIDDMVEDDNELEGFNIGPTVPQLDSQFFDHPSDGDDNVDNTDSPQIGAEDDTFLHTNARSQHATPRFLSMIHIHLLRAVLASITTPSWIERPPPNLDDPSHGKLKCIQWIHLFTALLPLAIWDLYEQDAPEIENFFQLVGFVNLACSHEIRGNHITLLTRNMAGYLSSCFTLHHHFKIKPNHHMALPLGEVCEVMGPLPYLAVFAGERINYLLRTVPHNNKPRKRFFKPLYNT